MLESGTVTHPFLTLAQGGGDWSALQPGYLTPSERAHCQWNRRLDGPHS